MGGGGASASGTPRRAVQMSKRTMRCLEEQRSAAEKIPPSRQWQERKDNIAGTQGARGRLTGESQRAS